MKIINSVPFSAAIILSGVIGSSSPQTMPQWFPHKSIEGLSGWTLQPIDRRTVRLMHSETKRRQRIVIDRSDQTQFASGGQSGKPETGFSAGQLPRPIGAQSRFNQTRGISRDIEVLLPGWSINSQIIVWKELPNGRVEPTTDDCTSIEPLQEGITRGEAARLLGASASHEQSITYRGKSVRSYIVAGNSKRVLDAAQVCEKLGIQFIMDYTKYIATLSRGSRSVKVLVGTPRFNANGTSEDTPTLSAEIGDSVFVQAEALDTLF